MNVLSTREDDDVTLTISIADEDHRFDFWTEDNKAFIEYQETLSWRGNVHVSEPDEDVYKALLVSEEMTELLEDLGLQSVQRVCRT